MQPAQPHSLLVPLLLGALVIWRFYSRIRRMVTRQKLSKVRPWVTVCVFPIVVIVFAVISIAHPLPLVALAGDKGYRADWIDAMLLEIGVQPVIPSRVHEHHEARPIKFDKRSYRRRNIIERLIGWLKESRAVFSRFEKTAINYAGMIKMACIRRYLKILTDGV